MNVYETSPEEVDKLGRVCRVVEQLVAPRLTIAQALHADQVNAGLSALGLTPLRLPPSELVRELIPIKRARGVSDE